MQHNLTIESKEKRILSMKKEMKDNFKKRGIKIGIISGALYGVYTALLTLGMSSDVWSDWYGENNAGLTVFTITYLLAALGNALNDTCSAVWALGNAAKDGKFNDFLRTVNSKPGRKIMLAALLGGPIAGTAYVIALQMAGSIIVPISALCPAISAILGKIFYKQEINRRMALGILICVSASFLIGSTGVTGGEISIQLFLGIIVALIAAFGWGFEGCVAGYASAMVDTQIGICIRQLTSGIVNLFIVIPLIGVLGSGVGESINLTLQALSSPAMIWFVLSGLAAFLSFMMWYAGNSMCGSGLGTACNGTYSFFGPFFCWIVLGVIYGKEGWSLPLVAWIGAVIMILGILIIAMNPLDLIRNKKEAI
ncbi:DMT family transporter [Fusobacterium sp.]|uniref:DMT family transporter n=1 Tax=Fusobacterium sp. TaxID=68766 RepID=UPI0025B84F32|nr:DMT family transporter [Fusobacterium sp.]